MKDQEDKSRFVKQKMTLLLDGETIAILREYGREHIGSTSVSAAVRAMAKEHGRNKKSNE